MLLSSPSVTSVTYSAGTSVIGGINWMNTNTPISSAVTVRLQIRDARVRGLPHIADAVGIAVDDLADSRQCPHDARGDQHA